MNRYAALQTLSSRTQSPGSHRTCNTTIDRTGESAVEETARRSSSHWQNVGSPRPDGCIRV